MTHFNRKKYDEGKKYYYLDVVKDCDICNGSGMGIWSGNDCNKCLKEIDLSKMEVFQLEQLIERIKIRINIKREL